MVNTSETRSFTGEPFATNLANWLNDVPNGKEKSFVLELMALAQWKLSRRKMAAAIQSKIADVTMRPVPDHSHECGSWIAWRLGGSSGLKDEILHIESWPQFGTGDAIVAVLTLWQQELLVRIIRCECGNWFHGRFPHSKFCSAECQQRYPSQTETFKARRREYMRKYQQRKRAHEKRTG